MDFSVSVIIPCYNAGRWIADALASVAAQSLPCHELIVIDDGSSDDSLKRVAASAVPVRLLHTQRANAAGARNVGIQAATGSWVALLDADDIWYPHHLQAARELIAAGDVAYLAHCDLFLHEKNEQAVVAPYALPQAQSGLRDADFLGLWSEKTHFPTSGMIALRNRVLDVGGFDATQVRRHDFELFFRIVKDRTWAYQPKPSWRYRVGTPQSISKNDANCWYFALRAVLKNEPAYRGPLMDSMVHRFARAAMTAAFLRGDEDDRRRAYELAAPHLGWRRRAFYRAIAFCPRIYPMIYQRARGALPQPVG